MEPSGVMFTECLQTPWVARSGPSKRTGPLRGLPGAGGAALDRRLPDPPVEVATARGADGVGPLPPVGAFVHRAAVAAPLDEALVDAVVEGALVAVGGHHHDVGDIRLGEVGDHGDHRGGVGVFVGFHNINIPQVLREGNPSTAMFTESLQTHEAPGATVLWAAAGSRRFRAWARGPAIAHTHEGEAAGSRPTGLAPRSS